jgi:predicted ATPase
MRDECECHRLHLRRRIVLTGGPGAGKTAVLELVRQSLCRHVTILPEAAGIVFGGGFPRNHVVGVRRAAQRAIYFVQQELEAAADAADGGITLCDRGMVDGFAYWPGPDDFWTGVGADRAELFARYDAVIHLRVPNAGEGYGYANPLRVETWTEARAVDDRIVQAWEGHPRRYMVDASSDFLTKANEALEILHDELPGCCRTEVLQALFETATEHAAQNA